MIFFQKIFKKALALPLILTLSLLGVNTPFSAPPKEAEPVVIVEDAAAWDALFSLETLENVTYTTHTVLEDSDAMNQISVILRDGNLLEYRYGYGEELRFSTTEEYLPEEKLMLEKFNDPSMNENAIAYIPMTEEGWASEGSFSLSGQFTGRFDEAVFDEEEGCYQLTLNYSDFSIYVENNRLVKIADRTVIGGAVYTSESLFTDYGTTVVDPLPLTTIDTAADAETWAYAFSAEGLGNGSINVSGENAAGSYNATLVVGDHTASLDYYCDPTEANPDGVNNYAYESAAEGVYAYRLEEDGWRVTMLDPEISWNDALLSTAGFRGLAKAFDSAVYDAERGCYTLALNEMDEEVQYTVYFLDGALSFLRMESASVSYTATFTHYQTDRVEPIGPFNAVG